MSTIHQIYCTHCTHGSSALERREGELAHRMLGYSARAGSMESHELRRFYRQIERYVYYYLPRDTPGEEKLRLVAATAPRRLVFLPSTSSLQLIAQVCYRQADTEGRPGSYFAHVVFQEEKTAVVRWSPLDALTLWSAAGWVSEDSAGIPFLLPPLGSLATLQAGQRPAVDDGMFWSFLTTPANGAFDDPGGAIPLRWRQMTPEQRCALFREILRGLLTVDAGRHASLVIVAEPTVAAVIFYGIVRLLPPGIRETVSFSTYEPSPERGGVMLAATMFHDPGKSDLRPEAYRGRGFALNTYLGRRTERRSQGAYAESILGRLLGEGWTSVDRTLENLRSAGVQRLEELDALAVVDRLVPVLFDPAAPLPSDDWRRSPTTFGYLRRALARSLGEGPAIEGRLAPLAGRPAHLLFLELLLTGPEIPGTRAAIKYLLKKLPADRIAGLLCMAGVARDVKEDVLARYLASHAQLPPGCESIWEEPLSARAGRPSSQLEEPLLPRLLARLDLRTLEAFYQHAVPRHGDTFVAALFQAFREKRAAREAVTRIVEQMSDEALLSLFYSQGPAFFREYPRDETALGKRLQTILRTLPQNLGQFRARLDLLLAGSHLLPDDQDRAAVEAWAACRSAVLDIGRLQDQRHGLLRRRPVASLETACRRMAEAIARALPADSFEDDPQGSRKQDCLHRIGSQMLGGKALLPRGVWQHEALWQKIAWLLERGKWPAVPLSKLRPKKRLSRNAWMVMGAAGVLLLSLAFFFAFYGARNRPAQRLSPPRRSNDHAAPLRKAEGPFKP